jgi:phage FluMu gp28-like protein
MDVAATHDFTVIVPLAKTGATLRGIAVLRIQGTRLPAQKAALRPLLADKRVRRAAIDSTGIGLGLVQDMEDEFPGKVEGVNFAATAPISERLAAEGRKSPTARVTEIMATELAAAHEDKRISYPCDATMRDDLRKPHKVTSASGRVSIAAESTQTGHADHFWALALAVRAAAGGAVESAMQATAEIEDDPFDREPGALTRRSFM